MDELVFVFAISPSKIQEENIFLEAQRLISKCDHLSSSRISVGISLWEMHILGPLSRPTNSETLELMPNNPFLSLSFRKQKEENTFQLVLWEQFYHDARIKTKQKLLTNVYY